MTARIVALVVVWVAAVGLAGCTTPSKPSGPSSSSTSPPPNAQQTPKDRDKEAVLAALRQIDLCAVVDAAMTAPSVLPAGAEPRARQPFGCVVEGLRDNIDVKVVSWTHEKRVSLPTRTLGGAKAYVDEDLQGLSSTCAVYLPVSFELAIEFLQMPDEKGESCRVLTGLAAASATVLAAPETVRVDPRWDACTVLAKVVDSDTDLSKLVGNGLDDCTDFTTAKRLRGISFADENNSSGQPRVATIRGMRVHVYEEVEQDEHNTFCRIYWRQGPFTSRFALAPDYQVFAAEPDCDKSMALAESVMNILDEPPPTDVEPQRPLLYAPNEADSPFLAECAYAENLSDPRRCEPHREGSVPDEFADAWEDAQVMCAVSVDAVGKHFGTRLRPIAVSQDGTYCYFVEPERSIQVEFVVRPVRTVGDPEARTVTVAGHPGFVEGGGGYYTYTLSTSSTTDGDASVVLTVRKGPVVAKDALLPAGTDKKAEAVLADVLRKYFP